MATQQAFNTLTASLGCSVPLLIDLIYQEGYAVPTHTPKLYTKARLEDLRKPSLPSFGIPESLTFRRYRTENIHHVDYVHAKKSFWRYNFMWSFLGVTTTLLQLHYVVRSIRTRRPAGALAAAGAMGLTWGAIMVEGKARRMYLDEMMDKVKKEEEKFTA
jgi:hypothetical protein